MHMMIDGEKVLVTRRRMKNMYLYVRPPYGSLEIRAPYGTSDKAIWDFVCSRRGWIEKRRREIRARQEKGPEGFLNRGVFNYWGVGYDLEISRGAERSLDFGEGRAVLTLLEEDGEEEAMEFVKAWYKERLSEQVATRLPQLQEQTGLEASSCTYRWMKTRWGSCNTSTHRICLNVQLAARPPIYLDYVIIHELVHTRVSDHGPGFRALMDKYMPDWRQIRRALNGKENLYE